MKKSILAALLLLTTGMMAAPKENTRQTAVFHVEIHCQGCVDKIQKNIAFERGVKDMRIDQKAQTVSLTWDTNKTDTTQLKQAFEKIKKPVSRIDM